MAYVVPNFLMGAAANADFSPVQNALAKYQQAQQFNASNALARDKLAEDARQFNTTNALAQSRFGEDQRQFGLNYDLRKSEAERSARQWGASHALDQGRFEITKDEARRKAEADFDAKAAGVLDQHILSEKDPIVAGQRWQKFVAADPRIGQALQRYGVDPNDHVAGAKLFVGLARGYKEPEAFKLTELDPNKTLLGTNPRTGETRVLQGPAQSNFGPYKDAKQKADVEEGLRKEVTQASQTYNTIRDASNGLSEIAKTPSAATDIGMVFQFMKILDPGSVVRETEYATAAKAAGMPERMVGFIERIQSGQFLTPSQRQDFLNTAQTLARAREQRYRGDLERYNGIARRVGVDPRNVVPGAEAAPDPAAPPPASRPRATNPQTGEVIEWDGSQWVKAK